MNDVYLKITWKFSFLIDLGLKFSYTESTGKLDDRIIQKFTYENPSLHRRFEIVYCITDRTKRLYGFLYREGPGKSNLPGVPDCLPFGRLRCFFGEGGEIIYFGGRQFDFDYQLSEFKLVIDKFTHCVISDKWIDYDLLLANEREIYTLSFEQLHSCSWIEKIISNDFITEFTEVVFDQRNEPAYEGEGLKIKSNNGIGFYMLLFYENRLDVGCLVEVTRPDHKVERHEFINDVNSEHVIDFIKQTIKNK